MKTYRNLYPRVIAFENLRLAFRKARKGKRARPDVAEFEYDLEANLLGLQEELAQETYRPGGYRSFSITDPKPRLISAAPFRDRVVHHALCNIIEPLFDQRFISDSYACRRGKGTHAAVNRAQEFSRRFSYVLKCDIEHFFPRVDHEIIQNRFQRVIVDEPTLRLCALILDSGAEIHRNIPPALFKGDDLLAALRPRGLPIGNLTSQFWANVYLNPLDHFIKRELKCRAYLRYVDDFLLFARNKDDLHTWRSAVIQYLVGLRLTLHENEAQVFPVHTGVPFLGWRIYPDHRRLRRRNGVAFQRRLAHLLNDYAAGKIRLDAVQACIQGWIAHVCHGDTWRLRYRLLANQPIPQTRSG